MKSNVQVQDVMKRDVSKIEEDKTGADALRQMENQRIRKLLVVSKDGDAIGVLEKWRVTEREMKQTVGKMELSAAELVPIGTQVSTIQEMLRKSPAVFVHDAESKKNIVGVITAHDFASLY
jgi:predicted transcriptional regulator